MNTIEQTASTTELYSPVICRITITFVSEQSTELSKGCEVVSARFQTVEYCLPKNKLSKTEDVSSREVVSSRSKILEYYLPRIEIPNRSRVFIWGCTLFNIEITQIVVSSFLQFFPWLLWKLLLVPLEDFLEFFYPNTVYEQLDFCNSDKLSIETIWVNHFQHVVCWYLAI